MRKTNFSSHQDSYKSNPIDTEDSRMRRREVTIELRKFKKAEQMFRRRNLKDEDLNSPPNELNEQLPEKVSIDEIIAAINSDDQERQFFGLQSARKMLSPESNPPIDLMIGHGIVPICIRFLQVSNPMLQLEAAWALTNITAGTLDHTRCVTDADAVPHIVALLQSELIVLAEQAVSALGNIAASGATDRFIVVRHGVIEAILPLINTATPLSFLRKIVWLMSNLCRNPSPPLDQIKPLLPVLSQMLLNQDIEVLVDACWALSNVTDDDNSKIQAVIDTDAVPRLVKLLQMDEPRIIVPALRSLGNIVNRTEQLGDVVIASGALPRLEALLQHSQSDIVGEAAWTVRNLATGNQEQIQALIDAGIFLQLRKVLETGDFKAQMQAAWAVTNTTTSGTPEQNADLIVKYKILKPFTDLLEAKEPRTILLVETGLSNLFAMAKKCGGTENLCLMVEEIGGLDKLETLQQHENVEVYQKAFAIIDTYFSSAEDRAEQKEPEPEVVNEALEVDATQPKTPENGHTLE